MRRSSVAVVALIVVACGGGSGDENAVSANPPAAAPSPQPTAQPPAREDSPDPVRGSAPAPEPPAASPEPGPAPATIRGELVASALTGYTHGRGIPVELQPQGFDGAPVTLYQDERYSLATEGPDAVHLALTIEASFDNGRLLAPIATVTSGAEELVLRGPALRVAFDSEVPITATLNTWSASDQFVRLLINEQGRSGFEICWHVEALGLKRLTCNTFDRATAAWRSAYVFDDTGGTAREYR